MTKMESRNLHWQAKLYRRSGDLEKAAKMLLESIEIDRKMDLRGQLASELQAMGNMFLDMGRRQDAMAYTKQMLEIAKEMQDDRLMMKFMSNLGRIHQQLGNCTESEDFFTRSLELSRSLIDPRWTGSNLNGLGDLCFQGKDYACALNYYQQALSQFESIRGTAGMATSIDWARPARR